MQWHDCDFVAFCNIGLREEALLSKNHEGHEKNLQTQTKKLLTKQQRKMCASPSVKERTAGDLLIIKPDHEGEVTPPLF